ncbi:MAG: hypothetical protein O3A00_24185 [Planctomycetota bacterium]|nr:hypothetical protein [Planctomycetota bacterium]
MQAGTPERVEFEYLRHGTQCLTGSWHAVLSQMFEPTVSDTRTEPEFVLHITNTVSTDGSAKWVFVEAIPAPCHLPQTDGTLVTTNSSPFRRHFPITSTNDEHAHRSLRHTDFSGRYH